MIVTPSVCKKDEETLIFRFEKQINISEILFYRTDKKKKLILKLDYNSENENILNRSEKKYEIDDGVLEVIELNKNLLSDEEADCEEFFIRLDETPEDIWQEVIKESPKGPVTKEEFKENINSTLERLTQMEKEWKEKGNN